LLGPPGNAQVVPDGAVERGVLGDQQVAKLLLPAEGVLFGGEVAALTAPAAERPDHPVDQLPDAGLALGRALLAAEVLLGHDVDGQLRPGAGDLDVLLLKDQLAFLATDGGGAALPLDKVVSMAARGREVALEPKPLGGSAGGLASRFCCDVGYVLGHSYEASPCGSAPRLSFLGAGSALLSTRGDRRGPRACPPHMPRGLDLAITLSGCFPVVKALSTTYSG